MLAAEGIPRLLSRGEDVNAIIAVAVLGNAAVTGVLSSVDDRYQARVIWLVPLLAGVLALEWLDYAPPAERLSSVSSPDAGLIDRLNKNIVHTFVRFIGFNTHKSA